MATMQTRPGWYTDDDDTAWSKVKSAFRRDWQQTKHDMGGDEPNLNQQVGDTIAQATGSKPIPPGNMPTPHASKVNSTPDLDEYRDEDEPAYRFGYAAYQHLGNEWDDEFEDNLRNDWGNAIDYERRREAIRRGWTYAAGQKLPNRPK